MADSATSSKSWEEKVSAMKAECKDMKVSELKMKLMSKGILTSTFCEKDEFVTAYAEILVKQEEEAGDNGGEGQATTSSGFPAVTTVPSDDNGDGGVGEDDDGENQLLLENLPPTVQKRVDELKSLHTNYEDMMKEYLVARAKLESEFQKKTQPLYEKRRDLITGKIDVSSDVVEGEESAEDETSVTKTETEIDQKASKSRRNEEQNVVGIPKFWVLTLTQMPVTASMISEHDVDCLGYLTDITCDNFENGEGFQLNFHFSNDNPYFNNEVLTKRYDVPNLLLADEPILKNVEGCEIQWKEGKTLLERKVTKQQRGTGKNAGQVRTITKTEPCDSFFKFFVPPKMPGNDQLHTTTEEEVMKIEAAFDEDYDVAQALRSHVIPKAVQWFLGNAMEQEMEAAMMAAAGGGSGLGASSLPNGGAGGENPECKQQ
mmetsp:Transcript_23504/g.55702  ORF Transcript_23504/g.55702 Transcript_23504/m.55702 type:complete len:431 (-) Transcript_23504:58-1350(-)